MLVVGTDTPSTRDIGNLSGVTFPTIEYLILLTINLGKKSSALGTHNM
jgi:hypothetical protein